MPCYADTLSSTVLVEALVDPVCVLWQWAASFYCFQHLNKTPKLTRLHRSAAAYMIFATMTITHSFIYYGIGRPLRWQKSSVFCQSFISTGNMMAFYTIAMLNVFWFQRIAVTFKGTSLKVNHRFRKAFWTLFIISVIYATGMSLAAGIGRMCREPIRVVDYNIYGGKDKLYGCVSDLPYPAIQIASGIVVHSVLTFSLAYDYLRKLSHLAHSSEHISGPAQRTIRKSCFVALTSLFSSALLVGVALSPTYIFFRLYIAVNSLCIISVFTWGTPVYEAMFWPCRKWFVLKHDEEHSRGQSQVGSILKFMSVPTQRNLRIQSTSQLSSGYSNNSSTYGIRCASPTVPSVSGKSGNNKKQKSASSLMTQSSVGDLHTQTRTTVSSNHPSLAVPRMGSHTASMQSSEDDDGSDEDGASSAAAEETRTKVESQVAGENEVERRETLVVSTPRPVSDDEDDEGPTIEMMYRQLTAPDSHPSEQQQPRNEEDEEEAVVVVPPPSESPVLSDSEHL